MSTRFECPFCRTEIPPGLPVMDRSDYMPVAVGGFGGADLSFPIFGREVVGIDHGTKPSVKCPGCNRNIFTLKKITTK